MKILMAPVNISGQPIQLVNELRKKGIDANLLQYGTHQFGYEYDKTVNLKGVDRAETQINTLKECLEEDYDIYHFWLRTLFFGGIYENFTGLDLPFIKNRGKKIIYRFTGQDLRIKSEHIKRNPHNFYKYGVENRIDENIQKKYIEYLKQYVDKFIVQDPEMHEFFPDAEIVPRALDLTKWFNVGIKETNKPLIIHAPSKPEIKGTNFIVNALDELANEGYSFDRKMIINMPHDEAVEWYKKADIVIDQLHIGWYGVLAMECMALGKPVITYIREDLYEKFCPRIPIENANPINIKEKIKILIKDYERRKDLSMKARGFVKEVHDAEVVTDKLIKVYNDTLIVNSNGICNKPMSFMDIDYFMAQYKLVLKDIPQMRFYSNKYKELLKEIPKLRYRSRKYEELLQENKKLKMNNEDKSIISKVIKLCKYMVSISKSGKNINANCNKDKAVLKELPELRYKARKYDEQQSELKKLRYYSRKHDELIKEVRDLRHKIRNNKKLSD